jgi:hypothetical protein
MPMPDNIRHNRSVGRIGQFRYEPHSQVLCASEDCVETTRSDDRVAYSGGMASAIWWDRDTWWVGSRCEHGDLVRHAGAGHRDDFGGGGVRPPAIAEPTSATADKAKPIATREFTFLRVRPAGCSRRPLIFQQRQRLPSATRAGVIISQGGIQQKGKTCHVDTTPA